MQKKMNATSSSSFSVIKDNYEGFSADQKDDGDNKILNDDFLDNLKAVDVPDSDEECYF